MSHPKTGEDKKNGKIGVGEERKMLAKVFTSEIIN